MSAPGAESRSTGRRGLIRPCTATKRRAASGGRIAPLRVMVPLWAAVYRAPTAAVLPVDVSVWIEGATGSLKSTLAALALAHYGPFDRLHLPGAWTSTANQLERRAYLCRRRLFHSWGPVPSVPPAREQ